ncbi:MAG: DUF4190 domain-containing protein [Pyrinomonadaceae bacterium]|jgi:hypothetical protein
MNNPHYNPYPGAIGPKPNQTLAIVSLVSGIIGLVLCGGLVSPIAVITGIMARKRAASNPMQYGGAEIALVGLILGIIGSIILIFVLLYIAFVFILGVGIALSN